MLEAISLGYVSIEVYIYLIDEDPYIGHRIHLIDRDNALLQMYLNPLLEKLDRSTMTQAELRRNPTLIPQASIFGKDPDQTLVLLVDFKGSDFGLLPYLQE